MNIDVNAVLVVGLVVSIVGNIVSGYWNYKLFQMVLRAISPTLRHPRTEPMPALRAFPPEHRTEDLSAELEGLSRHG
jgi:hypothetical protein